MKYFTACADCKPPKRQPGCHSRCPDYLKDKAAWEKHKEMVAEKKRTEVLTTKSDYFMGLCKK